MKIRSFLAVAATVAAVCAGAWSAPITYVLTGTMSGSLNGVNFTNAGFAMEGFSDTSTRTLFAPGVWFTNLSTYAVTVSGFSTVLGTDSMTFFDNHPNVGAGFSDLTRFRDVIDFRNSAFASYDAISAIGPLSVHELYLDHVPTTGGDLVIGSASSLTFEAFGGVAVPEPGTLGVLVAGLLGLGWFAGRRQRQS